METLTRHELEITSGGGWISGLEDLAVTMTAYAVTATVWGVALAAAPETGGASLAAAGLATSSLGSAMIPVTVNSFMH